MKKLMTLISALLVLLSGFMFTGCDEELEEILAPSGTWYQTTTDYSSNDSSSTLYVYYYWNDTEKTFSGTTNYTAPAGLTVVVTTYSNSTVAGLTNGKYTVKTWANGEDFSFDEDDTGDGISDEQTSSIISKVGSMNRVKWGIFYQAAKAKAKDEEGFKKLSGAPECLTGAGASSNAVNWENIKNSFSWKKIIANYLLDSI